MGMGTTGTTEPTRSEAIAGLAAEQLAFADLVAGLTAAEWDTATRCEGWRVREVAAHVLGNAIDSVAGTIGGRSPDEQARALSGGGPAQTAGLLREETPGLRRLLEGLGESAWSRPSLAAGRTLANGVLTLWYDTYVHADDIRSALGRPAERGPGLTASVWWIHEELERLGRGPWTLRLDTLPERQIGGPGGPVVGGDPLTFVLAATGRGKPSALGLDESIDVYSLR